MVILDNDWQKDNEKFCRPMISCKETLNTVFSNAKNGFKKHLPAIFLRDFFHVCIINNQLFEKLTRAN